MREDPGKTPLVTSVHGDALREDGYDGRQRTRCASNKGVLS
jgi:hypothetical protein